MPINYSNKYYFSILTSSNDVWISNFSIFTKLIHNGKPTLHIKLAKKSKLLESVCWLLCMLYTPPSLKLNSPENVHINKNIRGRTQLKFNNIIEFKQYTLRNILKKLNDPLINIVTSPNKTAKEKKTVIKLSNLKRNGLIFR